MNEIKNANEAKRRADRFVAEIDPSELAVRLIERGCHIKRPAGLSGQDAWAQFEKSAASGSIPEYIVRDFEAMAHIAIAYFGECVETLQRPS
jgi:hypothetical protein